MLTDNYIGKASSIKCVFIVFTRIDSIRCSEDRWFPWPGSHYDEIKLAKVTCLAINYGIIQQTLLSANQQGFKK